MLDNKFFNPTPLYKEYLVLELIYLNRNITQREISNEISVSLSMVNQYLNEYELKGFIEKKYLSPKNIEYLLTKAGIERMRVLNIWYLSSTQNVYKVAKKETQTFLNKVIKKGLKKIIFYGAGEVAEILLQTINDDNSIPIEIVAVVDDSKEKIGKRIVNHVIQDPLIISTEQHDAIMISSYTNHDKIYKKLIEKNYPKNKIVYFFS